MNTAPTTRETADHAELARLADEMVGLLAPSQGERLLEYERHQLDVASRIQALSRALLSEIAALRGGMENLETAAFAYQDRATQAERQRDELLNAWRDDGIDLEDFGRIVARLANQRADQ